MIQCHIIVAAVLLILPGCMASESDQTSAPPTITADDGSADHTTKNGDTMGGGPPAQSPPNKPDVPQNSSY